MSTIASFQHLHFFFRRPRRRLPVIVFGGLRSSLLRLRRGRRA